MTEFPQTRNTGNLQKFIKEIPTRGVPAKVNQKYLESVGYKSKNDRTIPSALKFITVLDSNGAPSKDYSQLRDRDQAPKILKTLIRKAYSELFTTYPDAPKKDASTLKNWFASKTTVGEASLKSIVQTFQALCTCADFSGVSSDSDAEVEETSEDNGERSKSKEGQRRKGIGPTEVCFNIQVQIPGDQKPETYEAIFKNLGKYVLGISDES